MTPLFRLIDTKLKIVVGYEWHLNQVFNNISIIHCYEYYDDLDTIFNNDIFPIPHDRKDMWTGLELPDKTKLFQRDEGLVTIWEEPNEFVIEFKDGAFVAVFEHMEFYLSNELKNIKLTGIEGVE
jgi:hypothetical protein